MVSTRKIKFIFSENEKVLCYEPDPKKAKVLYESKILECCVGRDSNGRKRAQYLVHFYGWNSSWDRRVDQHNIVKDNAENRILQRSLAEKAALALKGKKLKLNKIPAIIKEIVVSAGNNVSQMDSNENSSEHNSDCGENDECDGIDSNQIGGQSNGDSDENSGDDLGEYTEALSCSRTSISASIGGDFSSFHEINSCEDSDSSLQIYRLTNDLKNILDKDYSQVVVNKSLYDLPIKPNVSEIIDNFIINNNMTLMSASNQTIEPNQFEVLLPEFKSSLQIYFNSLMENNYLFYGEEEKVQYKLFQQQSIDHCEPTQMYGFIHLLRLLVAMPDFLLSTQGMSKKQLKIIIVFVQNFIEYLNRKRDHF